MVMKPLTKNTLREIRGSLGRYLAILLIIALGVGFFAGLRSSKPDMTETGETYLREHRFQDFRLLSTLGFTQEDVDAFAACPGVTRAAGGYSADVWARLASGDRMVVRAHSLTEGIDLPALTAGRMPETPEECLADAKVFTAETLGTSVTLSQEEGEEELLTHETYTIVGLCTSPRYLNYERGTTTVGSGTLSGFLYLLPESFDSEAFHEILLTADLPGGLYSQEYETARDDLGETLETLLEERADLRYETLYGDARTELEDARAELDDGWQEYRDGESQAQEELSDAREELEDAQQELDDGWAEVLRGEAKLADARLTLQNTEAELAAARKELTARRSELEEGKLALAQGEEELAAQEQTLLEGRAQLEKSKGEILDPLRLKEAELQSTVDALEQQLAAAQEGGTPEEIAQIELMLQQAVAGLAQVQGALLQAEESFAAREAELAAGETALAEGKATLEAKRGELEAGETALAQGEAQLAEGLRKLEAGKKELAAQEQTLSQARTELREGETELEKGRQEYDSASLDAREELEDARQELLDGEREYADGQEQLSELEPAKTYLLDRDANVGYVCFENDTDIVEAVSVVFPPFFFLVAAFVCITTMTRMVEEHRTQIGTLKAMGYSNLRIMSGYLIYSGSAAAIGWLVGYFAGVLIIPRVIWSVYGIMYGFAPLRDVFSPGLFLLCLAAALLCSCGTVALVCRSTLRETAASLIRPKSAKAGKTVLLERVKPLWKRLSFLKKVSVRNIFRYRSRLMMMLIGVGGCTALLVAAFGLRDSIQDIVVLQFEQIQHDDFTVTFGEPPSQAALEEAASLAGVSETLLLTRETLEAVGPEGLKSVQVLAGDKRLETWMTFRQGGRKVALPDSGVLVSEALADRLGLSVGEELTLRRGDGSQVTAVIQDTFENYVYYYAVFSDQGYAEAFGQPGEQKTLLVTGDGSRDAHEIAADLGELPDVGSVSVNEDFISRMDSTLASLNYIVIMVVICGAALAFIVLYNLTNINITERAREIATLKVLGFYPAETAAYIFREVLILSGMGALVGLPLGVLLHRFVMDQIQVDLVSFPNLITPVSYLLAFGLTLVFALGLSLVMRRRIDRIDMVESLKSVE